MSKKLLLLASLIFCTMTQLLHGQKLFDIPDTVCLQTDIVPTVYVQNAQNYSWTFCPPQLGGQPEGTNENNAEMLHLNSNTDIKTIQVDSFKYAFTTTADGKLVRYQYVNGIEEFPYVIDFGTVNNTMPTSPNSLSIIQIDSVWRVFVLGTTSTGDSKLLRVDFANGLNYPPTNQYDYGNLEGSLSNANKLFIGLDSTLGYYAFTFNDSKSLVRIHFNQSNISANPTVDILGNIDNKFNKISAITGVLETSDWHLYVTDYNLNKLVQITFGHSFANTPFVIDMGGFNNSFRRPTGISITKNCDNYFGYVVNEMNNRITTLVWGGSIADAPTTVVYAGVGGMLQPAALSNSISENGNVYMFVPNSDQSLTRIKFSACTNATVAGSNQRQPIPIQYDAAGTYTIYLTVNEGLPNVQSYCRNVVVQMHPELTISTDTLLCQNDTANLHALTWNTDSISWAPNYNIDTTFGKFVNVWPNHTTYYHVYANFGTNCLVHDSIRVAVGHIDVDAGADRTLVDGSTTVIGGPGTSLGSQYTYQWTPNLFFNTATNERIAEVKPGYNITYYLTVTDSSGCAATDSVWVKVPCAGIVLPNAFAPNSGGATTYGIMNLQIAQLNYFKIFNRWGKEVFSTTNPSQQWDGLDEKGKQCEQGVYVWEVDAYCTDTKERFRNSGTVTLLRP